MNLIERDNLIKAVIRLLIAGGMSASEAVKFTLQYYYY